MIEPAGRLFHYQAAHEMRMPNLLFLFIF